MSGFGFEVQSTDGAARRGQLSFPRGTIETPAFMPHLLCLLQGLCLVGPEQDSASQPDKRS